MLLAASLCLYPVPGIREYSNEKDTLTYWKAAELTDGGISSNGCKSNDLDNVVVPAELHLCLAIHWVGQPGSLHGQSGVNTLTDW